MGAPAAPPADARAQRLAAALRANLRRRKGATAPAPQPADGEPPNALGDGGEPR